MARIKNIEKRSKRMTSVELTKNNYYMVQGIKKLDPDFNYTKFVNKILNLELMNLNNKSKMIALQITQLTEDEELVKARFKFEKDLLEKKLDKIREENEVNEINI